jgi:hypothetical protein
MCRRVELPSRVTLAPQHVREKSDLPAFVRNASVLIDHFDQVHRPSSLEFIRRVKPRAASPTKTYATGKDILFAWR